MAETGTRMSVVDIFDFVTTWALRIGLVAIGAGVVFWLATVIVKLAIPSSGVALPAVEIVGGSRSGQGPMLTHLLGAQLRHIRDDFTRSVRVLNDNLDRWQLELKKLLEQEQKEASERRAAASAKPGLAMTSQEIGQPAVRFTFDPVVLESGLEHLKLFAESLGSTKAPEIRVSGVDLGSVLQWFADRLLPKSEHSLMLVEDGQRSVMLLSGPLFGDGTVDIDLGPANPALSPKDIVEPVAYHVLATSLRAIPKNPVDLGEWGAIRYFVRGLTGFAEDASVPEATTPENIGKRKEQRAEIITNLLRAAEKIRTKNAGQARDIVSFAAFFAGQVGDHEREADILDRNAALFNDSASTQTLTLRINLARKRALTRAVDEAVRSGAPGSGAGLAAATSKLVSQPGILAALKIHRVRGGLASPADHAVRVAILGSAPPLWFGLHSAASVFPSSNNFMSTYVGGIAQVIRTLTPNAAMSFIPVGDEEQQSQGMAGEKETLAAIEDAKKSDAQIVVIPLGPLRGKAIEVALRALAESGKLVILPAGNEGNKDPTSLPRPELTRDLLFAASISPDGMTSWFSNTPEGALSVVGEKLPQVIVENDQVRLEYNQGTGPAAAVLAAVAVDSKIRFPNLSMANLGKALRAAAVTMANSKLPIAVVP